MFCRNNVRKSIITSFVLCLLFVLTGTANSAYCQASNEKRRISTIPAKASIDSTIKYVIRNRQMPLDSLKYYGNDLLIKSLTLKYNYGIVYAYNFLAFADNSSNGTKGTWYYSEALRYLQGETDSTLLESKLKILLSISENYDKKDQLDSSAYFKYEALKLVTGKQAHDPRSVILTYGTIFNFWLNTNRHFNNDSKIRNVFDYFESQELESIAKHDSSLLSFIYFNKAGFFNNQGKFDSSIFYYKKFLAEYTVRKPMDDWIISATLNTVTSFLKNNNTDSARIYFEKVQRDLNTLNRPFYKGILYSKTIESQILLSEKKYNLSIKTALESLAMADSLAMPRYKDLAYNVLSEAYENTGDYKNATVYLKKFMMLKDSFHLDEKNQMAYFLDLEYQTSEKDKTIVQKELAIAQKENALKAKNFWILGITALFIILLLSAILLNKNNRQKIRLLNQQIEINHLQDIISGEEKERSRLAKELHDGIGGSLAALKMQLQTIERQHKEADTHLQFKSAIQMLSDTSAELRKTAHNLMPDILKTEGLFNAVKLFCNRISSPDKTAIECIVIGDLPVLSAGFELSVYRIIQELVQNIIKHANASEALVQISCMNRILDITVEDNGIGLPADKANSSTGIGMESIKQRITKLNGTFDIQSALGQGTSINIEFAI